MRHLIAMILSLTAASLSAAEPASDTVADLDWMAGHWRMEHDGMVVEEGWFEPSGGTMLGINRSVSEGRTVAFEFLRLEEREGEVVLFANPDGRCPATPFGLVELGEREAVFANPEHDFPQRIVHRRDGDRLTALIDGRVDGERRRPEWRFALMP
jgi:hypothetical protein